MHTPVIKQDQTHNVTARPGLLRAEGLAITAVSILTAAGGCLAGTALPLSLRHPRATFQKVVVHVLSVLALAAASVRQ